MIALAIHGGAWDIPDDLVPAHKTGLQKALKAGWEILGDGGSAVDAVERTIALMEDDETFNAGRGACLNAAGEVELDAGIMEGKSLAAGAVAAVHSVPNPISLARKIMESGEEVMLVGMGALRFARDHKMKTCDPDDLITAAEIERWRRAQESAKSGTKKGVRRRTVAADTVGAVALDKTGNIAAGTSTGGTPDKSPGRVGDASLIGCGTYADAAVGGVSASGTGESIIRVVLAMSVIGILERNGGNPEEAAKEGISMLERKVRGAGGLIVLSRGGVAGVAYNTRRMARAVMTSAMKVPLVAV